jgi:hypothetical protein
MAKVKSYACILPGVMRKVSQCVGSILSAVALVQSVKWLATGYVTGIRCRQTQLTRMAAFLERLMRASRCFPKARCRNWEFRSRTIEKLTKEISRGNQDFCCLTMRTCKGNLLLRMLRKVKQSFTGCTRNTTQGRFWSFSWNHVLAHECAVRI